MAERPEQCKSCVWWTEKRYGDAMRDGSLQRDQYDASREREPSGVGVCRGAPPQLISHRSRDVRWPITEKDDYCAQHRARGEL